MCNWISNWISNSECESAASIESKTYYIFLLCWILFSKNASLLDIIKIYKFLLQHITMVPYSVSTYYLNKLCYKAFSPEYIFQKMLSHFLYLIHSTWCTTGRCRNTNNTRKTYEQIWTYNFFTHLLMELLLKFPLIIIFSGETISKIPA